VRESPGQRLSRSGADVDDPLSTQVAIVVSSGVDAANPFNKKAYPYLVGAQVGSSSISRRSLRYGAHRADHRNALCALRAPPGSAGIRHQDPPYLPDHSESVESNVRRLGPSLPIVCHTTWTTWPPVRLRLASQLCAAANQQVGLLAAARRRSMLMIYTTDDQTFSVLVSRTSFRTALRISALF
jgi:hypothetical protein